MILDKSYKKIRKVLKVRFVYFGFVTFMLILAKEFLQVCTSSLAFQRLIFLTNLHLHRSTLLLV